MAGVTNIGNAHGYMVSESERIADDGKLEYQADSTVFGLKVLCVLVPAIFIIGSWAAFRFVWNITPDVRAKMAEMKRKSEPTLEELAADNPIF